MTSERVYYHVVFSVTRGKPVFLDDEIDAAFKREAREIARQKGWLLLDMETMPNHAHLLFEKAPWDDLSKMVGYLKGRTARAILEQCPWLRGDLNSYQFWNRSFHYTRHSDKSLDTVRAYIRNQRRAGGLIE
jgi:putative transposase